MASAFWVRCHHRAPFMYIIYRIKFLLSIIDRTQSPIPPINSPPIGHKHPASSTGRYFQDAPRGPPCR